MATTGKAGRGGAGGLAWALRFAQVDTAAWRDGDWLNAWEDARTLADLGLRPSLSEVKERLGALQGALADLVERVKYVKPGQVVSVPVDGEVTLGMGGVIFVPRSPGRPKTQLVERVLFEVLLQLGQLNSGRLKHCPECDRVFVPVRRQRFDTAQCSLRDRMRRFRQKGTRRPVRRERSR